jgi:hypothetical protein
MKTQQTYILIAVVALLIILGLKIFLLKKKNLKPQISPLAGLAFSFLLAGMIFRENRSLGYSLVGVGLLLAIIDLAKKFKRKSNI